MISKTIGFRGTLFSDTPMFAKPPDLIWLDERLSLMSEKQKTSHSVLRSLLSLLHSNRRALASCNIRLPGCKFDEVNRWCGSKSSRILWKFEIGNVLPDFGSFPCSHTILTFSFLSLFKIEMLYITGTWMYLVSTRWNMDNRENIRFTMFHRIIHDNR